MSVVTMNDITLRTVSVAALFVLGSFATGCAFDPDAAHADADESEATGTVQQAAIVWRAAGPGVAPGCGASREKGNDGLCYTLCPKGFRGEVTRCIEVGNGVTKACIDERGICVEDTTCVYPTASNVNNTHTYKCTQNRPQQTSDRGVGVPASCALLQRTAGKDGLCYPLTSSSGDITPAPAPAAPVATAAPSGGAVRTAADKCNHTFDSTGHPMVWVPDGFGGRCITQAESPRPVAAPSPGDPGDICPLASGCEWQKPGNMYDTAYSSTKFVTTTKHDLLGYGE